MLECASIAVLVMLAAPAGADVAPVFSPLAASPGGALQALARAYSNRSVEALAGLYTADFAFQSTDPRLAGSFPATLGRDHELQSAGNLFHGTALYGKPVRPPAQEIAIRIGDIEEAPDPEHPDALAQYRLLSVKEFSFFIRTPAGDTIVQNPSLHVFHLVRGDAAMRVQGQTADTTRWYIRRWLEDVDGLAAALAKRKGDCNPEPATRTRDEPGVVAPPLALAIHALGNPACPTIDVMCDVPSIGRIELEVFDVMGRRVNRQTVAIGAPGTQRLQAGAGAEIRPGAYWVRVTQGAIRATRMVVVAR